MVRRNTTQKFETFTCVRCEQTVTPHSYNEKSLTYNPDVVARGEVKDGPHCKRCVGIIQQGRMSKYRNEAYKREQDRQDRFKNEPKPDNVSDFMWNAMKSYACCPKAKTTPCVCMYSFTCPEHGNIHIGTHD